MQTVDNLFDLQNYKHKNTKTQENRGEKKTKKEKTRNLTKTKLLK
nr:MAG: hypothetical protein AmFV_00244 [Apis mellifera filamentous virus]